MIVYFRRHDRRSYRCRRPFSHSLRHADYTCLLVCFPRRMCPVSSWEVYHMILLLAIYRIAQTSKTTTGRERMKAWHTLETSGGQTVSIHFTSPPVGTVPSTGSHTSSGTRDIPLQFPRGPSPVLCKHLFIASCDKQLPSSQHLSPLPSLTVWCLVSCPPR